MTTAQQLLDITKDRYLLGGLREQRNRLNAPYTAGSTTMQFQGDLRGIKENAILSVGRNTIYVWGTTEASKTAEVEDGYLSSFSEDAAFGAPVEVNPRYTNAAIFDAINEEIQALSSPGVGLYAMRQVEFAYSASLVGYNLTAPNLIDVFEVRFEEPGPAARTPRLDTQDWRLERNYTTGENASTYSLKMHRGGYPGRNVTVLYRAGFTPFTALTDDVTVTGIPDSMLDIVPLGAAIRLGIGKEPRRNQTQSQGDTRRAEEVTPGSVAASWRGIQGMREQRIQEELARLVNAYPPRV